MPARRALALQALVDEALVGGVLVDDDDAVLRLRDDVGAVDLRPRRAERGVGGLGLPEEGAHVRRGRKSRERRLLRLGKARRPLERRSLGGRLPAGEGGRGPSRRHAIGDEAGTRRRADPRAQRVEGAGAAGRRGAKAGAGERVAQRADDERSARAPDRGSGPRSLPDGR